MYTDGKSVEQMGLSIGVDSWLAHFKELPWRMLSGESVIEARSRRKTSNGNRCRGDKEHICESKDQLHYSRINEYARLDLTRR